MSPSGLVITRVVKPAPAPLNEPDVTPAPKISSLATEVETEGVVADADEPLAEAVLSTGLDRSSPLYSVMRRSTYRAGASNVTVTRFAPAPAAAMFRAT